MTRHEFGGDWTTDKLERVRKYLVEYTKIFRKNPKAQYFSTTYVDAFAGSGQRSRRRQPTISAAFLPELTEADNQAFLKGSARIALEVEPSFDRYVFVELDADRARELELLREDFPEKNISVRVAEANSFIRDWCGSEDWKRNRAVVFLDPYGMQVDWSTVQAIARTQAIDLWLLFPLGAAVSRLLTKAEPPPRQWAQALTRFFGTDEWLETFYPQKKALTLWAEEDVQTRQADFDAIGEYFVRRLEAEFAAVAPKPLPLLNSKNVPLYLLCFAAGNPKGAPIAVRIADSILRR